MKVRTRTVVIVALALVAMQAAAQNPAGLYGAVRGLQDAERSRMEAEAFELDQQIRTERLRQERELYEARKRALEAQIQRQQELNQQLEYERRKVEAERRQIEFEQRRLANPQNAQMDREFQEYATRMRG